MVEFLHSLAIATPLPGGGAAAIYSLGLAVGLIEKVSLLEIHRQADHPGIERDLMAARKALGQLRRDVADLIERDPDAYRRIAGGDDGHQQKCHRGSIQFPFHHHILRSLRSVRVPHARYHYHCRR